MSRIPVQTYERTPQRLPLETVLNEPIGVFSNYCLDFDGGVNNQYIRTPVINLAAPYTIVQWVRNRSFPAIIAPGVWSKATTQLRFGTAIGGFLRLRGTDGTEYPSIFNIPLNTWSFIGVRANSSTDFDFIRNGVVLDNFVVPIGTIEEALNQFEIGRDAWWPSYHDGFIDEFQLIAGVVTDADLREIFARGYARRVAGSIVNLRMEESAGLMAFDDSGLGNNGDLIPALTPPTWTDVAKYELLAEAGV
ncbi:hypothetical protein ES702_03309 [subsurface metagenome]